MMDWIVSVLIKGFLNWLRDLWEAFTQKQEHIQQGRDEVLAEVEKQTQEFKDAIKETGAANADLAVDDITRRLRERYSRHTTGVSGTTPDTTESN